MTAPDNENKKTGLEIAVIGLACRFPSAKNPARFWENLKNGVETISFFNRQELAENGANPAVLADPDYIPASGYLEEADYFDAVFFGYTPLEAAVMDPQLRIYHECVWEALEDAACNPAEFAGPIGVYSGAAPNPGWAMTVLKQAKSPSQHFDAFNLNSASAFGTMISYNIGLHGPSFSLQTACSTSLVAVHLACQGLLIAECDIALAGGASINPWGKAGYVYQQGMINSPDGHCRVFDARAQGTLRGEGVGVAALKRLAEAIQDGDHIYAVIKGSAINNDGSRKVGYTAPSVEGQAEVIRTALAAAEVEPASISYIEAHGTGTDLGDPVELEGLKLAFDSDKKNFCSIGALKSNMGHLDTAAGIAGFIKTVLALQHRLIPPSLHFESANPRIDFENSPFRVCTRLTEWEGNGAPLRAAVSSFGIGGTNAHVILEEWIDPASTEVFGGVGTFLQKGSDPPEAKSVSTVPRLFLLSARTRAALEQMRVNLAGHLQNHPQVALADAAYTLQTGRKLFKYRGMTICETREEAIEKLTSKQSGDFQVSVSLEENPPVVFMFPGQGAQYVDMGRRLYETQPRFRQELESCFEILKPSIDYDLKEILYPSDMSYKSHESDEPHESHESHESDIDQTEVTQPALFVIEYALARLLMSWGITPTAMIGHSIGEYTAACLAGVFSLEDALMLVAWRGKLMQQMPRGAMLSAALPDEQLVSLVPDTLSLAAVNGRANCVVSGPAEELERFAKLLADQNIKTSRLHTSHAFHSQMMDPVSAQFAEKAASIRLHEPQERFISNLTGDWIKAEEAVDPQYWAQHLRRTVRFHYGLTKILQEESNALLLEVGPGRVLSTLARQHPQKTQQHSVVQLMRHVQEEAQDDRFLMEKLGHIWQRGGRLDWQAAAGQGKRRRVSLPTYPFERQSFAAPRGTVEESEPQELFASEGKRTDIGRWFYVPVWKGIPAAMNKRLQLEPGERWLIFADAAGLAERLAERLRDERQETILVGVGEAFGAPEKNRFTLQIGREKDYDALYKNLKERNRLPDRIVHLWNVTPPQRLNSFEQDEQLEAALDAAFYSLLYIVRALARQKIEQSLRLAVVSSNMHPLLGGSAIDPMAAALLGPARVIPQEYPNIKCRSIDIAYPPDGDFSSTVEELLREIVRETAAPVSALRAGSRWEQVFEPYLLEGSGGDAVSLLKQGGVYLITGGLGGMGLTLAAELAKNRRARLVLVDKIALPATAEWEEWLQRNKEIPNEPVSLRIERVRHLEKLGAETLVCSADVTDPTLMRQVIDQALNRFGAINGVIHTAGLADAGLIQVRSREQSARVLAAKIKSTLVLDSLLRGRTLDFFLVCSSLSTVLAPAGQAAYVAANSFLDAYALYKARTGGCFTIAVGWDTWQEVGMAVAAVEQLAGAHPANHPLLESWIQESELRRIYISRFNALRFWVLDGHRIMGKATLPGTAYLELVAAAYTDMCGSAPFEIRELFLLTPLALADDEQLTVHTVLENESETKPGATNAVYRFSIRSRVAGGSQTWQEHARGRVGGLAHREKVPARFDLEAAAERCAPPPGREAGTGLVEQGFLKVGPRWKNLTDLRIGAGEGLADIQLPTQFADDLKQYRLHPALLDTATAFLTGSLALKEPLLPFLFKGVRVQAALPARFVSYARVKGDPVAPGASPRNLSFQVTIMDEQGKPLLEIEDFMLVKVSAAAPAQPAAVEAQYVSPLDQGILPVEGVEVFNRLLAGAPPQVLVSTSDFLQRLRASRGRPAKAQVGRAAGEKPAAVGHPRPELSVEYEAPKNQAQQRLADIWQQFLGIGDIGILDDFFELGGDSLKGLSVLAEIHKQFNVELSIADFFVSPTIQGLAQRIGSGAESIYAAINPVEKREYYLLSSAQKRLYFLQKLQPLSTVYNIPNILALEGALEKERLQEFEDAFKRTIRRQQSLRTGFYLIAEQAVQRIHEFDEIEFSLLYHDRQNPQKTDAHRETPGSGSGEAESIERFVRHFDLSRPPLLRLEVVSVSETRHLWLFDIHHIVSDATGLAIFYNELFREIAGAGIAEMRVQYRDFSQWQNDLLASGGIEKQRDYWLKVFADGVPRLNLPTDFPRPQSADFSGDMHHFRLPAVETEKFLAIGIEAGATLFMNLAAVLNVLLFKYSGRSDIVLGSSIAGRPHADLREIIGMFVNMLALRNFPRPEMSYVDFLQQVKSAALAAFENQDMQFEMLVEELGLKGDTARNPLFDICINVQNYEQPGFEVEGLTFADAGFRYKNAKFDILLWANQIGGEIRFMLEYAVQLYKPETAQQFAGHLCEIMEQVGNNGDIKLQDIKLAYRVVNPATQAPQIDFDF